MPNRFRLLAPKRRSIERDAFALALADGRVIEVQRVRDPRARRIKYSALADLRQQAAPVAVGVAALSRGTEDHASFSTQAARSGRRALGAYEVVLSTELVAAMRTLHLRGLAPEHRILRDAHARLSAVLDARTVDRPLEDDLEAAATLLPDLAAIR